MKDAKTEVFRLKKKPVQETPAASQTPLELPPGNDYPAQPTRPPAISRQIGGSASLAIAARQKPNHGREARRFAIRPPRVLDILYG